MSRPARLKYEYEGQEYTIPQLSEISDIPYKIIRYRLYAGWQIERAITEPVHTYRNKNEPTVSSVNAEIMKQNNEAKERLKKNASFAQCSARCNFHGKRS